MKKLVVFVMLFVTQCAYGAAGVSSSSVPKAPSAYARFIKEYNELIRKPVSQESSDELYEFGTRISCFVWDELTDNDITEPDDLMTKVRAELKRRSYDQKKIALIH